MMDYSKVTHYEYIKKRNEMFDYYGRKDDYCYGVDCNECPFLPLYEKYSDKCSYEEIKHPEEFTKIVMDWQPLEPEVDWSKVAVDTPIYVRNNESHDWLPRHFAKYKNGTVYTWCGGATTFSIGNISEDGMCYWKYAKLARPSETAQNDHTAAKNEKPKNVPITNREWLFGLSDAELAEELCTLTKCSQDIGSCSNCIFDSLCLCKSDAIAAWLKQERKE